MSIQKVRNDQIFINTFERKLPFIADKLIVSTSLEELPRFVNINFKQPFLNIVENSFSESTLRIVVQLDKALPVNFTRDHFDHYSSFRWCLRGPRDDMLIISYVDGEEARNRFTKVEAIRKTFIQTCLNELQLNHFNVVKTYWYEWPCAFTVIGEGNNHDYDSMHKIGDNIYTTCLPAPFMQAWIEGVLLSSVNCVEYILCNENNYKN
jgi:hypothetical protein